MSVEDFIWMRFSPRAIKKSTLSVGNPCRFKVGIIFVIIPYIALRLAVREKERTNIILPLESQSEYSDLGVPQLLTAVPDHNVSHHRVTEGMDNVRDHALQHLAQLEESRGDAGADFQPLTGNLTDVLPHIAPSTDGVVQKLL